MGGEMTSEVGGDRGMLGEKVVNTIEAQGGRGVQMEKKQKKSGMIQCCRKGLRGKLIQMSKDWIWHCSDILGL